MALDEQLESITESMKKLRETMEAMTATSSDASSSELLSLQRRLQSITMDWESVHDESDILREELKEDKWLTVFRTVTEQADGMMSSLEKAVNRCQVRLSEP